MLSAAIDTPGCALSLHSILVLWRCAPEGWQAVVACAAHSLRALPVMTKAPQQALTSASTPTTSISATTTTATCALLPQHTSSSAGTSALLQRRDQAYLYHRGHRHRGTLQAGSKRPSPKSSVSHGLSALSV